MALVEISKGRQTAEIWVNLEIDEKIVTFTQALRRRQIVGSGAVAREMLTILTQMLQHLSCQYTSDVVRLVRDVGNHVNNVCVTELAIGNIVRRVLRIIRDECRETVVGGLTKSTASMLDAGDEELGASLPSLFTDDRFLDQDLPWTKELRESVLEQTETLEEELGNAKIAICEHSIDFVHSNEIIMTCGMSQTVEEFLAAASRKRTFEVWVLESAPSAAGHTMAKGLTTRGIQTMLLTDAAVFAMMSRVNKVVVGCHAVFADGSLLAHTGTNILALAAKAHSVPFVVCTGMYKLCPVYPYDQHAFNDFSAPSSIISFDGSDEKNALDVVNPDYDMVASSLVSTYVTNYGNYAPSYIYRVLTEYYHPIDYVLHEVLEEHV